MGKLLASHTGWKFLDVDKEIEKIEGMSIQEIFEKRGEEYFRKRELEVLVALAEEDRLVISTGGGLGSNPKAMEFMKTSGLVVWLMVDFHTFLKRCGEDPSRPLLKRSREHLLELFKRRSEVYSKAHVKVDATQDPKAIVEEIMHACKGEFFVL